MRSTRFRFLAGFVLVITLTWPVALFPAEQPEEDPEADEIRAIEARRLAALENGDAETARAFHAEDYQLIAPSGTPVTRDEYLGAVGSGQLDYLVFKPVSPIRVRRHGDIAVIRYQAHTDVMWDGVSIGNGRIWHTDVYEKRDGRWQVVWSQATTVTTPPSAQDASTAAVPDATGQMAPAE